MSLSIKGTKVCLDLISKVYIIFHTHLVTVYYFFKKNLFIPSAYTIFIRTTYSCPSIFFLAKPGAPRTLNLCSNKARMRTYTVDSPHAWVVCTTTLQKPTACYLSFFVYQYYCDALKNLQMVFTHVWRLPRDNATQTLRHQKMHRLTSGLYLLLVDPF